jgi:hypothetical protein
MQNKKQINQRFLNNALIERPLTRQNSFFSTLLTVMAAFASIK